MPSRRAEIVAAFLVLLPAALGGEPAPAQGRGRLVPLGTQPASSGQWRQGFDLADLDGDGDLDIVHGPPRGGDGRPRLFVNDGHGGYEPWREASLPELAFDYGDAAAADFDADGRVDVALAAHLRGFGVIVQKGRGRFVADEGWPAWTTHAGFTSIATVPVDWDGDGRTDLIALSEGPRPGRDGPYGIRVLHNRADGWSQIEGENAGRLFGDGLVTGDFDGDGRPDAAAAARSLAHRGQVFLGQAASGWKVAAAPRRRSAYTPAIAACDVDGDQRDEILLGFLHRSGERWRNGVDLLDLDRQLGWRRSVLGERTGEDAPRALGCGDLDADGHPDLVAGSSSGRLTLYRGRDSGSFHRPRRLWTPERGAACTTRHLELADLDGEPGAEIVASFASEPSARCTTGGSLRVWRLR